MKKTRIKKEKKKLRKTYVCQCILDDVFLTAYQSYLFVIDRANRGGYERTTTTTKIDGPQKESKKQHN